MPTVAVVAIFSSAPRSVMVAPYTWAVPLIDSVPTPLSPTPPAVRSAPSVRAPVPLLIVAPVPMVRLPVAYSTSSGPPALVTLLFTVSATSDPEAVRLIAPPELLTGPDSVRAPVLAIVTVPVPA